MRKLASMAVGLLLLGVVTGVEGQPTTEQIPVCRVEVTWERLETENISPRPGRDNLFARVDLWSWGMAAAELPPGVSLTLLSSERIAIWDDDNKDALAAFGPIHSRYVPSISNPWVPRRPVLLLSQSFTREIQLQIATRTWNLHQTESNNAAYLNLRSEPPQIETVLCPPTEPSTTKTIKREFEGLHFYTYRITTQAVRLMNVPAVSLVEN